MLRRELIAPVAIIAFFLLGTVAYLYYLNGPQVLAVLSPGMLTGGSAAAEQQQAVVPPHAAKKTAAKRALRALKEPDPAVPIDVMELVTDRRNLPSPLALPVYSFPTSVEPGVSRERLFSTFGFPVLSTTWYETRSLNERYVYVQGSQATTVYLRNAQVVSSVAEPRIPGPDGR